MIKSQIDLNEAQAEKLRADATLSGKQTEGKEIENALAKVASEFEIDTKYSPEQKEREKENLLNEYRVKIHEWLQANEQTNLMGLEEQLKRGTLDEQIKQARLLSQGMEIKNEWDKSGIPQNDGTFRQAYKVLKANGKTDEDAAIILLSAGVAEGILKNIVPAGLINKVLNKFPKQKN